MRIGGGRGAPLHQDAPPLGLVEQRQQRERPLGIGDDRLQQPLVVGGQPGDGGGIEEIGAVHDAAHDRLGALVQLEVQIELGAAGVHVQVAGVPAGRRRRPRGLQRERHLEERVAAGVALDAQLVDERLERHVLVGQGFQRLVAHAGEQLVERRIAAHVGPQRHRVGEEAEQPLDLGPRAAGADGAEDEIVLARIAVQQHLEAGQQGHEQAGALAPGQRAQLAAQPARQRDLVPRAGEALHRRARAVGGQHQRGRAGQPAAPPRDRILDGGRRHALALPVREVRVLHGQGRQG